MIELVSGAREFKKTHLKKLLTQSAFESIIINSLAKIIIFWCGASEKS
jgi:hypothetical protein